MEFLAVIKTSKLILMNLLALGLIDSLTMTIQAQTYQSGTDIPTQFKSAEPGTLNVGNPPSGGTLGGANVNKMYFCSITTNPPGVQPLEPIYSVPVSQSNGVYSAYSWVRNSNNTSYTVTGTGALAGKSGAIPYINVGVFTTQFVQGSVRYGIPSFKTTLTSTTRRFQGNGIPSQPTGIFPVRPNDPAYPYYSPAVAGSPWGTADKIPVTSYQLDISVPLNPTYNDTPQCINLARTLIVGVSLNGDTFHHNIASSNGINAVDPVTALPLDLNWGHPYSTQYHRHAYIWKNETQTASNQHSSLIGYALDGFGIYGPKGENGVLLTNQQLDVCHGHIHAGQSNNTYHYHANNEFPYAPACFRGTPTYPSSAYAHNPATHRVAPRGLPSPAF